MIVLQHVTDLSGRETLVRITGTKSIPLNVLILALRFWCFLSDFTCCMWLIGWSWFLNFLIDCHILSLGLKSIHSDLFHWYEIYSTLYSEFCTWSYIFFVQVAWRWKLIGMSRPLMLPCLLHRMFRKDARFGHALKLNSRLFWSECFQSKWWKLLCKFQEQCICTDCVAWFKTQTFWSSILYTFCVMLTAIGLLLR